MSVFSISIVVRGVMAIIVNAMSFLVIVSLSRLVLLGFAPYALHSIASAICWLLLTAMIISGISIGSRLFIFCFIPPFSNSCPLALWASIICCRSLASVGRNLSASVNVSA